jgi:hypothetical protein
VNDNRRTVWDASHCALLLIDYQDSVLAQIFEQDRRLIEFRLTAGEVRRPDIASQPKGGVVGEPDSVVRFGGANDDRHRWAKHLLGQHRHPRRDTVEHRRLALTEAVRAIVRNLRGAVDVPDCAHRTQQERPDS